MRVVSGEKANAVQPSTAPSRGAFSLPATNLLFRPNQEISRRARNHRCSPVGPRSTRQFAAVPTPPRKKQQALATPFSHRLGGEVKKHRWPRSSDSSAPVRRPPAPGDTPGPRSSLEAARSAQNCCARPNRWVALSRDGPAHDKAPAYHVDRHRSRKASAKFSRHRLDLSPPATTNRSLHFASPICEPARLIRKFVLDGCRP